MSPTMPGEAGLLTRLDAGERQELEALCSPRIFGADAYLFHQGELATTAFLIDSGEVALEMQVPGGAGIEVARVGAGQLLGEPILLQKGARMLSARACGEVACRVMEHVDFQGLLRSFRPVSFKLLLEVARLVATRFTGADDATRHLGGTRDRPHLSPAPPLGAEEQPGASFDPRPYLPLLPFFADFSPSDVDALLALGTLWEVPRGRDLLRCGQRSDHCFVVLRGAVEVLAPDTGVRLGLIGPGRAVGQLAPLMGQAALATCRVRERCTLLDVGPVALAALLTPSARVSFKFMNALVMDLLEGLGRANRVLARSAKLQLLDGMALEEVRLVE